MCARAPSHASLPSSFKNKEEIMNSKKDVICANEKKDLLIRYSEKDEREV